MVNFGETLKIASPPGSCDSLWESVKEDLELNRAKLDQNLQCLKGKSVKLSSQTAKQSKCLKNVIKKKQSKMTVKKALSIFRAMVKSKKHHPKSSVTKNGCVSTMNFEVVEENSHTEDVVTAKQTSIPMKGSLNIDESSPETVQSKSSEPVCRDQGVQVETPVPFQDKIYQPSSQNCQHLFSGQCSCKAILLDSFQPLMCVNPLRYGLDYGNGNVCCCKQGHNLGVCSSYHQPNQFHSAIRVISEQGVQTEDAGAGATVTNDIPWQNICEELVSRLGSRNSVPTKNLVSDSHESPKKHETESISLELRRLVDSLKKLPCGHGRKSSLEQISSPVVMRTSRAAAPDSTLLTPVEEFPPDPLQSVQLETRLPTASSAPPGTKSTVEAPQTNSPLEFSPLIGTPDLVKNSKVFSQAMNCITPRPAERRVAFVAAEKSYAGAQKPLQTAPSVIRKRGSVENPLLLSSQLHGLSTKNGHRICVRDGTLVNEQNAQDRNSEINIDQLVEMEGDAAADKTCDSTDNYPNISTTLEAPSSFNTTVEICHPENDSMSSQSAISKVSSNVENNKGDKVLSLIHETDKVNVIREEQKRDSPAFEEIDSCDMEELLLIWEQGEQLDHDQERKIPTAASSCVDSPKYVFRKPKSSRELPVELRTTKVVEPPPEKDPSANTSALELLEKEAAEVPAVEEDEDIPETEMPTILQPKKRRLRLKPNPKSTPRLPVVFQKSGKTPQQSVANNDSNANGTSLTPNSGDIAPAASSLTKEPCNANEEEGLAPEVAPAVKKQVPKLRSSKRLRSTPTEEATSPTAQQDESDSDSFVPKKGKKNLTKKQSDKRKNKKDIDSNEKSANVKHTKKEVNQSKVEDDENSKTTQSNNNVFTNLNENNCVVDKTEHKIDDFKDQIKERTAKAKQRWLLEKSLDKEGSSTDHQFLAPLPVPSVSCPVIEGISLSEENIKMLKDISAYEIGKAHDLAIRVVLDPWRGTVAKLTTKKFVCPDYDIKAVSRALWDLRSNADLDSVIERVLKLGWKDVHPIAFRVLTSMVVSSLARHVPFVMETPPSGDEDETSSIASEADLNCKKKPTSLRIIATHPIFKDECIQGLKGLIYKVPSKELDCLKSWNFPKLKQGRRFAIFGPLAYLKRKESDYNTKAILLSDTILAAKATRNILCGERLLVSFVELEK